MFPFSQRTHLSPRYYYLIQGGSCMSYTCFLQPAHFCFLQPLILNYCAGEGGGERALQDGVEDVHAHFVVLGQVGYLVYLHTFMV